DGIRDSSVTGVQTCALPIYRLVSLQPLHLRLAAAHRIDRARIRVAAHDLHNAAAQAPRIRRRADNRDRTRPQQLLNVRHLNPAHASEKRASSSLAPGSPL